MKQAEISFFSIAVQEIDFSNSSLLIYIGNTCFTYAIIKENGIVAFEKYHLAIKEVGILDAFFEEKKWLLKSFLKVKIAYCTNESTLLPSEMYNNLHNADVLETVYGDDGFDKVFIDNCYAHHVNILYRLNRNVLRKVLGFYPLASTSNYLSILLNHYNNFNGNKVVLDCTEDYYVVLIFQNAKLLAAKTFSIQCNEKLAYQVLGLCEMYHLEVGAVHLEISGWLSSTSTLYKELYKYFHHISFSNSSNDLAIANKEYESHFFKVYDYINQLY